MQIAIDPWKPEKKILGENLSTRAEDMLANKLHEQILDFCREHDRRDNCLTIIHRGDASLHRKLNFDPRYPGSHNNCLVMLEGLWRFATLDEAAECQRVDDEERDAENKRRSDLTAVSQALASQTLFVKAAQDAAMMVAATTPPKSEQPKKAK